MTDGAESVGSTESDTISLAGEPRNWRRRLSLLWTTRTRTPTPEKRESLSGSSAGSDVGMPGEPVALDVRARNVARACQFGRGCFAEIFNRGP